MLNININYFKKLNKLKDNYYDYSIIIPVYHSAQIIPNLLSRLNKLASNKKWEVIFIDDGSSDNSYESLIQNLQNTNLNATLIRHTRNFGDHAAILTAYRHAKGRYLINIDDDLQNPPEEILRIYNYAVDKNIDVVYGDYIIKQHSIWRNLGSKFANFTANLLLDLPQKLYLSSFRCVRREIALKAAEYMGPYVYIDGLLSQLTQSIGTIAVNHDKRVIGKSGYTLRRLIRLWLNIFTNFSLMPLRLATILGCFMAFSGFVGVIIVLIESLIIGIVVPGWLSMVCLILLFGGIQCFLIGISGEYLGRVLMIVGGKPQSNIRNIYKYSPKSSKQIK